MKKPLLLTTGLILALSVVGCSKTENLNTNTDKTNQESVTNNTISSEQLYSEINSLVESENIFELPFLKNESVKDLYFLSDVSDIIVDGIAYQAAMNVHIQDVIIVQTSDVDAVKNAFTDYLNSDAIRPYKDGYGGEHNITSIQNAIIGNVDNYAYLIAAPGATEIEKALLEKLNI